MTESEVQDKLARRLFEGLFVLTVAVAVYFILALISFDSNDPSWLHVGGESSVHNYGGKLGAWISGVLYSLLGYGAFSIPLILIYRAWMFFQDRDNFDGRDWPGFFVVCIGVIFVLLSVTGLSAINSLPQESLLPHGNGGYLGEMIATEFLPGFGLVGGRLVLFTLFFIGITISSDISWLRMIENIGQKTVFLSALITAALLRRMAQRHDQHAPVDNTDLKEDYDSADEHKLLDVDAAISQLEDKPSIFSRIPFLSAFFVKSSENDDYADEYMDDDFFVEDTLDPIASEEDDSLAVLQNDVEHSIGQLATASETAVNEPPAEELSVKQRLLKRFANDEELDVSERMEPTFAMPNFEQEHADDSVINNMEVCFQVSESLADKAVDESAVHSSVAIDGDVVTQRADSSFSDDIHTDDSETAMPAEDSVNTINIAAAPIPVTMSNQAKKDKQERMFDEAEPLPSLSLLLQEPRDKKEGYTPEVLEKLSRLLEEKLLEFRIEAKVTNVMPGPVVTRFEIQPKPGTKASTISNLSTDLARSLAVQSVRVVEVIVGKSVIGIEIPNKNREMVYFSNVVGSKIFEDSASPLTMALGHDIGGQTVIADLAKMPHLLVAGTTGSGKSVGVNAMLLSLLFKATPEEVRLILVDPKMLELSVYDDIPHLLTPVITDMKDAANGLRWCVGEMERRYKLMAKLGVRNLAGFNKKIEEAEAAGEPILDPLWQAELEFMAGEDLPPAPALEKLPFIVVVIDEFADMIMVVGKKVEELIARIAQKARAAGIHLILATQRPSVDIITGLIKANVPTRMAFRVSSKIDSRTILDQGGAEQLLGHGDMLYLPPGESMTTRVHGAFVADDEVHAVAEAWRKRGKPDYIEGLLESGDSAEIAGISSDSAANAEEQDALYDEAVAFVCETRKASISSVQRKLRIGYNRAARMIEAMEEAGVVSSMSAGGQREVLAPPAVTHS